MKLNLVEHETQKPSFVRVGRSDMPLAVQGATCKFIADKHAGVMYLIEGIHDSFAAQLSRLAESGKLPTKDALVYTLHAFAAHNLEKEVDNAGV